MFEKMSIDMGVLEFYDVAYHQIHASNLVISKCHINRASTILIFVEDWELVAEVLYVSLIIEQSLDRSAVECKVRDHIL